MATAFPIIFASIIGRSLSSLCRWRLEKGASIGFLETFMGSRTVGSTVVTLLQLRFATLATGILLVLWSVSPLGAQAFLRMLSTETSIHYRTFELQYSGWNASAQFTLRSQPEYYELYGPVIETIYSAVLISTSTFKSKPADIWGNIRIPAFNYADSVSTGDDWRIVHNDTEYVSLLGIPVNNTIPVGNTTFSIESSHIELQCSPLNATRVYDMVYKNASSIFDYEKLEGWTDDDLPSNGTWSGPCAAKTCRGANWSLAINRYIDQYWHDIVIYPPNFNRISTAIIGTEDVSSGSTDLLFQAYVSSDLKFHEFTRYSTSCNVRQLYVESRINCTKVGLLDEPICAAAGQRPSQKPHPSSSISLLSFPVVFAEIAANLPRVSSTGIPDLSLQYLFNPSGISMRFNTTQEMRAEDFGRRLSQLINTYIGAYQLRIAATDGFIIRNHLPGYDVTTGGNEWSEDYIQVSKLWSLICAISCLVLLICGCMGVVVGHIAKGPDMLGCVTSSVRDSRYVRIPASDTTLDGMDLAREMKARQIRAGVLGPAKEDGAIVYGIGERELSVSK